MNGSDRVDTAVTSLLSPQDLTYLMAQQMKILEMVAAAVPVQHTLDAVLTALECLMTDARCSVLLVAPSGDTLHHGAAPSLPPEYLRAIEGLRIGPLSGSCGVAAHLGEPVIARDVRIDHRWVEFRDSAVASGLIACWSTPIADPSGRTVGTFAVYHGAPHWPTARERQLVDRFTYLAAVALENGRLLGELIESEELFRRSFEDNPAGAALLGLDWVFQRVNTSFAELGGHRVEDLVDRRLDSALLFDAHSENRIHETLARGDVFCVTEHMAVICNDGATVPVEATFSLVRGRDNTPLRFALNLVDLTERLSADEARAERERAETARQVAESHSSAKSALLTSVSHEVRTPLQAIKGFTELLRTLPLDEERREEALARIDFASDHVLDLVTDVLDISRIEAGVLPLNIEPTPVARTVHDITRLLSAMADRRHTAVHVSIEPSLEVWADPGRLRQVLLNVIGNALRYGHAGGAVEISAVHGTPMSVITVSDDGDGIPHDYLPNLFTPFRRGREDRGVGSTVDGYGLGLMLSHGLVTAMGGTLTARNHSDYGAAFDIALSSTPRGVSPSGLRPPENSDTV
ncbi:GAF domain-containing sensor histidine kinase [Rhodococcus sp. BP-359]|uniref:GAF domain-containing sensor histidine kinase n=1 Tax=unclassified Rhodococcus (in: high G+C Gram-positive bacteria) TaxID=192944 RepID=UPI001C9B941F|nr:MULTISPECIES: GAF domain-containing sensor histidine kinase [unclassified Rhodococcus (in: high G+C Gram-positive bacteria)]MBY6615280.1 GAF domain-containing sensor histidine kinase [Rhodococcus sp. BP-352]MBY6542094.1 GAF domain-containing sensor histidine kinase [Rhodococcus sp. BP-369]MBY6575616.1 GAF domain-containing sensor histidine kinase [Rhodococcus sp. BP-364]MBY6584917.1 GAF domain-containing sensor histidine kinase [Rhodococcus sp. BP-358]MBY6589254.1 GAF domain-containing sens